MPKNTFMAKVLWFFPDGGWDIVNTELPGKLEEKFLEICKRDLGFRYEVKKKQLILCDFQMTKKIDCRCVEKDKINSMLETMISEWNGKD